MININGVELECLDIEFSAGENPLLEKDAIKTNLLSIFGDCPPDIELRNLWIDEYIALRSSGISDPGKIKFVLKVNDKSINLKDLVENFSLSDFIIKLGKFEYNFSAILVSWVQENKKITFEAIVSGEIRAINI